MICNLVGEGPAAYENQSKLENKQTNTIKKLVLLVKDPSRLAVLELDPVRLHY